MAEQEAQAAFPMRKLAMIIASIMAILIILYIIWTAIGTVNVGA